MQQMAEYSAKVEAEEEARKANYAARKKRYEDIGTHWAEAGAGKKQREEELKLERKILREAAEKEAADQAREVRDKRNLLENRLKCQAFNKTLIEQKAMERKEEMDEDRRYAALGRQDGENYVAKEQERAEAMARQRKQYSKVLKKQIAEVEAREKNIEMTDLERRLNSLTLQKLHADKELLARIADRIAGGEGKGRAGATLSPLRVS
ncbi:unnamed protein product [Chrysoparadoxa australica]